MGDYAELGPALPRWALHSQEGRAAQWALTGRQAEAGSPGGTAVARGEAGVGRGSTGGLIRSARGGQAGQGAEGAGLGEAGAARPPAGRPVAGATATALQAVMVVHVAAAAYTVQLAGSKLHALYVHFLLRVVGGDC